jgi:hypothetical protein
VQSPVPAAADKDAVRDRKEEQELPKSEAGQNGKVRAEHENTYTEQAEQKH